MGREVRMVPKDWQHPKDSDGEFIPLFAGDFSEAIAKWEENEAKWKQGMVRSYADGIPWRKANDAELDCGLEDWYGAKPDESRYMPKFTNADHLMMYETCTEGTPISPAFKTPEELARWLADNKASAFGYTTATYEHWLAMIKAGWSPTAMFSAETGMVSGVEAMAKMAK